MEYQFLIYDKPEDGIARITLNRPEVLNALHVPLVEEIYDAAERASEDPEVVVLLYRGAGRSFCAGRDFKYSGQLQTEDPEGWFAWRRRYHGFGAQTWLHQKATIAQVQGHALGGGHNLAVGCDITIVAEDVRFGYPEARAGLLGGGRHIWNWFMGPKKTKEYLFTGRTFGAQEALTFGLVNQVVPNDKLEDAAMSMAQDIVKIERRNPGYIRANKFQINYRHPDLLIFTSLNPSIAEQVPYETEYLLNAKTSQEEFYTRIANEGVHGALEKLHEGFSSRA